MLFLLELLFGLFELAELISKCSELAKCWRFLLGLAASAGVIALIYWRIPSPAVSFCLSFLVGTAGLCWGAWWQWLRD